MNIAIIGAMDSEIISLLKPISNLDIVDIKGFKFYKGSIGKNNVIVTKSGIGKVNMSIVVTMLLNNFDVDLLINTGIAGSYNTEINSVCIATEVKYHDVNDLPFDNKFNDPVLINTSLLDFAKTILKDDNCIYGKFLTGDQFVQSIEDLHGANLDNVVAVDMESMAVAVCASKFKIDFLIVRSISDNLSLDAANKNEFDAADKAVKIVLKLIENF